MTTEFNTIRESASVMKTAAQSLALCFSKLEVGFTRVITEASSKEFLALLKVFQEAWLGEFPEAACALVRGEVAETVSLFSKKLAFDSIHLGEPATGFEREMAVALRLLMANESDSGIQASFLTSLTYLGDFDQVTEVISNTTEDDLARAVLDPRLILLDREASTRPAPDTLSRYDELIGLINDSAHFQTLEEVVRKAQELADYWRSSEPDSIHSEVVETE